MTLTKNMITTDNADMITHYAAKQGKQPTMYFDQLTLKAVADLPFESQQDFYADTELQRFLAVKKQIWRAINELRQKYAGGAK